MILRILCLLVCLMINAPAVAADGMSLDTTAFRQIPVLHEGRVKPLDSFARASLKTISGKDTLKGIDAISWLGETLFDPAAAINRPVFYVVRPERLNLSLQPGRLYSYAQLAPVMQTQTDTIAALGQKDEKDWSEDQAALMTLNQNALLYTQLLRSFSGVLPLAVALPESLRREWKLTDDTAPRTLNDFRPYIPRIEARLKKIIAKKGDDFARYTDEEKNIATLGWQLQVLENAGQQNVLLRIVPPQWNGTEWLSPWALMQNGEGAPQAAAYLQHWKDMATAWQTGDARAWQDATRAALSAVRALDGNTASTWRLSLEIFYNDLHPIGLAMMLYGLAFIALIAATFRYRDVLLRAAFAGIILGAAVHGAGIVLRIVILERPPVGTLYESILFVSWICVIGGLIAGRALRDTTGLLVASLSGALLLFTAAAFAPDDTMQMLVAVLNTNFWLATHVICITIGYGWCLVASLLGHLALLHGARGRTNAANALQPVLKTTALCALLFTTVGTILGGIWADQSWGRFWGWDPKENGALLIVLWLVWILHGRISGQISRTGFVAGNAALGIVVALAWFGVNLLSTGLHSYGFIEGVALGLFAFCAAESALIAALWYKARLMKEKPHE